MGQLQETNWTKVKKAFPSLLGYSRLPRDPTCSARARWYSLEDDFELPPGLKAFCEGREGTAGIDELKSRVAKLDSLDAMIGAQAKAIEKLTESNAAMEKRLAELTAAVAKLKKPKQRSSSVRSMRTDDGAAAASEKKIAELSATVAQLKSLSFKSNRGPASVDAVLVQGRQGNGRPTGYLIVLVFLVSVLIGFLL